MERQLLQEVETTLRTEGIKKRHIGLFRLDLLAILDLLLGASASGVSMSLLLVARAVRGSRVGGSGGGLRSGSLALSCRGL
jgi:hypothetical protein